MRVVLSSRVAPEPVRKTLQAIDGLALVVCKTLSEVPSVLHAAEVLVISDPRGEGAEIAAALRAPGCKVRWIQLTTAGADGLTVYGVPEHIVLTNQGGAVAPTVAEHGMAMILAMTRQMPEIQARSSRHEWNKDFKPALTALEGKTLAIVGYGNLGRQLAQRARGFAMKIIGLSRSLKSDPLADEMQPLTALHEVLGNADLVALCVASAPAMRHLMDARAFAAMKPGAMFVNLSRGANVDQEALRQALASGQVGAAFLDVTEPEPLPPEHPLWDAPNLVISPHTAGAGGTRTGMRLAEVIRENFDRYRAGKELAHRLAE